MKFKKMIVAGDYADKAVNIGFDNISLDVTETDIIAQIVIWHEENRYQSNVL